MTIHLSDLSESARTLLREQTIELPSWAFGNSGTRFKVFPSPGTPRNAYEKIDDAAQVHHFTGITPRVSLHIPWDMVDDFCDLAAHARSQGITLGTINSNVFQDDDYKFGSLTNSDKAIRRKAIDAHLRCIDVMNATGSDTLKIWTRSPRARNASLTHCPLSTRIWLHISAFSWSTSSSNPPSTTPTSRTGARRSRT